MEKLRALLVDDDPYALDSLSDLLKAHPEIDVIARFSEPQEAVIFSQKHQIDLLFLDIQMPGMSGFELLDHLGEDIPEVIFVTSFDQYAIQAIRYSALDYLLKPVQSKELAMAISRYFKKSERVISEAKLSTLRHNLANTEEDHKLVLLTKQGDRQFNARDIIRCEADSNYTKIYLTREQKFLASKTLGDVEEMLNKERFIRIHKSHLVNLAHVKYLTHGDELVMSDQSAIRISRRRLPEVKMLIQGRITE